MNYLKKYLKYKSKYLSINKFKGGGLSEDEGKIIIINGINGVELLTGIYHNINQLQTAIDKQLNIKYYKLLLNTDEVIKNPIIFGDEDKNEYNFNTLLPNNDDMSINLTLIKYEITNEIMTKIINLYKILYTVNYDDDDDCDYEVQEYTDKLYKYLYKYSQNTDDEIILVKDLEDKLNSEYLGVIHGKVYIYKELIQIVFQNYINDIIKKMLLDNINIEDASIIFSEYILSFIEQYIHKSYIATIHAKNAFLELFLDFYSSEPEKDTTTLEQFATKLYHKILYHLRSKYPKL